MSKRIVVLLCCVLGLLGSTDAEASSNSNAQTAASWCYGLINNPGSVSTSGTSTSKAFVSPLIECFTDTTQGIIPTVTASFITNAQKDFVPTIGTMFVLAITYYGIKLMLGGVRQVKTETIILGLKMAGIMYFLNNAGTIYTDMLNILLSLTQSISTTASAAHSTGFCVNSAASGGASGASGSSAQILSVWTQWDCIFGYLLGLSGSGFAISGIASFLLMIISSMSTGIMVFFFGLYLLFALFFAVARFIHIYLMAILSLSFMFCIGFLFVPLLLFNNTLAYFQKWFSMVLGFILTPIIMFGFMSMMLIALDVAIFTGKYSIYCTIGGQTACSDPTSGATLFSGITSNVNSNTNSNLQDAFQQYFLVGLNGPGSMQDIGQLISPSASGGAVGLFGQNQDLGEAGSSYAGGNHPQMARTGVDNLMLNLQQLASNAGDTCNAQATLGSGSLFTTTNPVMYYNNCPWLQHVLISICVAALLVYIMTSILSYIPQLASDLASQGTASSGALFNSPVMGQGLTTDGLKMAKSGSLGAAQHFKSGQNINSALAGRSGAAGSFLRSQGQGLIGGGDE